ncbi:MAG: bacteriohemerythrin [Gammaproteobacteria bacterium]|nr:bacteriohemerythrin [Gammaproteobacteria bacterium]
MKKLEKIIWTEEFSVGHKQLNDQHLKIVSFINELIESPINDQVDALKCISRMLEYSKEHLEYEEGLLERHNYPEASSHSIIHQFYVRKVENFLKMSFHEPHIFRTEVLSFLKEWWTYHILEEDMKYRPFLEEKGIA